MAELDAQLFPFGVQVTLPSGIEFRLDHDDADTLGHMLTEARLNRAGLQPISVPASQVDEEDILPLTGQQVMGIVTHAGLTTLIVGQNSAFSLPENLEITVHRRIQ